MTISRQGAGPLHYLWTWYVELTTGAPLTYTEIHHWSQLTCRNIRPLEVNVLMRLDYLNRTND